MLINRAFAITIVGLLLAACSPMRVSDLADDSNQRARDYQLGAGLNVVEFEELECSETTGLCGPTDFRLIGGKEQQNISISMRHPETGNVVMEYSATGVEAFEGQAIRAEVEQALADADVEASQALVDSIVGLVGRLAGVP